MVERKLAAILSADVVGYSRLMAEDEAATVATLAAHREQVGVLLRPYRGRLVDFAGDNFLAEFPTASEAVSCAVEIQRVLRVRSAASAANRRMEFRIGVHLGEVRVEGERIYGSGVNVAARLQGLAAPGGVCISDVVKEQLRGAGLDLDDLGPQHLKNLPDPVHAHRLRLHDAATATSVHKDPSVAVLPFVNMSSDPDQAFFADGMSEEIINALTQVEGLRVIARTSAFSFKGQSADIATIGRRLDVSAIVEGSVRKAGDRLRIAAQLVDVEGGHHLWSEVYDRPLDDLFEIQDDIARRIVTTIKPRLLRETTPALVVRPTESHEAYELYLRAAERIALFDRWDTRTAIAMLESATALDPDYADAWARLALACSQMDFAFEPEGGWHARAEQAVGKAFALDPDNADAHFALGRILWTPHAGFQHCPALRCFRACLQRQPGAAQARMWRSVVLTHVGLLDEAREGLLAVLASDPDDATALNLLGQLEQFAARYEEADEYIERAYRANPTLWLNQIFRPAIRIYRGDLAGAEGVLRTARQLIGDDPILDGCESLLWAKRGEAERADVSLARASEDRSSRAHTHHLWHYTAAACAVLGRPGDAVERLRVAAATGLPNQPLFRDDPHLAPLSKAPEMAALLADLEHKRSDIEREFLLDK